MRFMILIKADKNSEAGQMPSEQLLTEMGAFNEELVKAGVMQAGEGLHPSSRGARVHFSGKRRDVVDGPFGETRELIAGFWIWQLPSLADAIAWVKRCPNPMEGESEIEIRQIFAAEDFGAALTPELRAQEDSLRAQVAAQAAKSAEVEPVPASRGATPYLVVKGAADAIAWYQRVFDAKVEMRLDAPDGLLMHAEMCVGPARFMLTEERPAYGARSPLQIGGTATTAIVYVPDVDATIARAIAAGAKSGMPLQDQFWGDRAGDIIDPFGHQWMVATHKEDPTPEEIGRRVDAMFRGETGGCS